MSLMPSKEIPQLDFGTSKNGQDWAVINDGVMGGVSQGKIQLTEDAILYHGTISLKNNGGFSSLRGPYERMDLSQFTKVSIRLKQSKGQVFAFQLDTNRAWYLPNYKHILKTETEDWETITVSLADFKEYQVGRETGRIIASEQLGQVIRLGFINTGKKSGPFELEIDYIRFE